MRLAGREWRAEVGLARLGSAAYRVIRPAHPLGAGALVMSWSGAELVVSQALATDLAVAWWLAARSPRSLVHLPLRSTGSPCGEGWDGPRLDLVLLHHSLQFPVSRWKQVRARVKTAPHNVVLPREPFRQVDPEEHGMWRHREFRDHLRWAIAADTLFLIGSRRAYELAAESVRALAEDSSAHLAEWPGVHHCVEIDIGDPTWFPQDRNPYASLHVECCAVHWHRHLGGR